MTTCAQPGCDQDAVVLVRSDGMNADGIMLYVMWSGWDRIEGEKYCDEHAGRLLAGLPQLRPRGRDGGAGGEVYTHG